MNLRKRRKGWRKARVLQLYNSLQNDRCCVNLRMTFLSSTAENLKERVKCMDINEAAKQEAKRRSLEDVNRSLQEQLLHPKNNALRMDSPLNLNACGPSSVQRMSGEDRDHDKRKKEQQEQVQYWCAEYTLEKKRALEEERRQEAMR